MSDDDGIEQFAVIVDRALVFLGRPAVIEQLLVLLVILVVSRLVSHLGWSLLGRHRVRRARRKTDGRFPSSTTALPLPFQAIESISAPLLGIGMALLALRVMERGERVTGLLSQLIVVFVVLLGSELIMTAACLGLDAAEARRYRRTFFKPLMWIVVGLMILGHVADVRRLAGAAVFDLFGSPISVGALFIATLGIWLWTDGVNFLNRVVVNFIVKHTSLNDGSAEATLMLVRYALILLGLAYVVSQLQLSPSTVAAITGGLSVGIGFGLREVLGNFISGTFMLFERSLRPGDIIEVSGEIGTVEKLSVRSTMIRTLDNEEIVIPNSAFFTESFKSFTGTDEKVRFHIVVMANCRNDVEMVRHVLHGVARAHPDVLDDPPPEAWVEDQFGNNVVSYRLHMWSSSPLTVPRIRSDIVRMTWKAFREANVQLVFPDLELHFNDTASDHLPVQSGEDSPSTQPDPVDASEPTRSRSRIPIRSHAE